MTQPIANSNLNFGRIGDHIARNPAPSLDGNSGVWLSQTSAGLNALALAAREELRANRLDPEIANPIHALLGIASTPLFDQIGKAIAEASIAGAFTAPTDPSRPLQVGDRVRYNNNDGTGIRRYVGRTAIITVINAIGPVIRWDDDGTTYDPNLANLELIVDTPATPEPRLFQVGDAVIPNARGIDGEDDDQFIGRQGVIDEIDDGELDWPIRVIFGNPDEDVSSWYRPEHLERAT